MNIQEYSGKFQHFSSLLKVCFHVNRSAIKYLSTEKTSKNSRNSAYLYFMILKPDEIDVLPMVEPRSFAVSADFILKLLFCNFILKISLYTRPPQYGTMSDRMWTRTENVENFLGRPRMRMTMMSMSSSQYSAENSQKSSPSNFIVPVLLSAISKSHGRPRSRPIPSLESHLI